MLHDNNLIEMSLRLNRSEPLFHTIRELPGIGRRPRTRDVIGLRKNLSLSFMVVRQKPTQIFIFRILLAMTKLPNYYCTITIDKNISNRFLQNKSKNQKRYLKNLVIEIKNKN